MIICFKNELFYKLIFYENCISVLKECFYIFSEYRACIYFMTPSINFNNTKKNIIENVIISFRDNINTLNQIISKIYLGDKNPWGSIYYSTAYSMTQEVLFLVLAMYDCIFYCISNSCSLLLYHVCEKIRDVSRK
jgi:hypothetical protein